VNSKYYCNTYGTFSGVLGPSSCRLRDCAPPGDGAAALVIAAEDLADFFTDRPVWLRGAGIRMDSVTHQHKPDMTFADVGVAQIHDFFTDLELISYEHLGFVERFGGHKLVEAEVTTIGGGLPVNPNGGLKAKGHPPVDGARIGLAHNIGGPTAVSAVTILEGSANGAG
jgi:acetyl-CoA C-acetyltransferase